MNFNLILRQIKSQAELRIQVEEKRASDLSEKIIIGHSAETSWKDSWFHEVVMNVGEIMSFEERCQFIGNGKKGAKGRVLLKLKDRFLMRYN